VSEETNMDAGHEPKAEAIAALKGKVLKPGELDGLEAEAAFARFRLERKKIDQVEAEFLYKKGIDMLSRAGAHLEGLAIKFQFKRSPDGRSLESIEVTDVVPASEVAKLKA
jgi:hypothetical protein